MKLCTGSFCRSLKNEKSASEKHRVIRCAADPPLPDRGGNEVRCKTQHSTYVTRNVTVSAIVSNRATAISVSVTASMRL